MTSVLPMKRLQDKIRELKASVADHEEVERDHQRLVREMDRIINGDNVAVQASLCDLVVQLKELFNGKRLVNIHVSNILGVRVEDNKVIITVRGGNDSARKLCADILAQFDDAVKGEKG